MRRILVLGLVLALGACGSGRVPAPVSGGRVPAEEGGQTSCVPFARARSGLNLRGDAWQWWEAAAGRFQRSRAPAPGAVLVLLRTSRLPQGHVSVVARVVSAREIRVDHANWGSGAAKGRIARDQPVVDVSPDNDWSLVRVWYPRTESLGVTVFPAYGFIHPVTVTAALATAP